ncbi:MAG TPA: molybdopterin converting factor subunit 1 [Hyphomicrobiaceae bacterium]|nr:molybdopterin converting factor subunit 1 [Hyphomicrobiaceae bacterium]
MTVRVVYFAWVRERIGRSDETIEFPADVKTVADAIRWLSTRGPEYEAAFARPDVVRAAVDQTHVPHDTSITGARELALFPPVTGG